MSPDDLQRFLDAQKDTHDAALAELRAGKKRSHWMWFVFPQLRGLGSSHNATFYGIDDRDEAIRYLAHDVLGPRLLACCDAVLHHRDQSAHTILGSPDDLKLRSSMTLFEAIAADEPRFGEVLERFFKGARDSKTLAMLER